MDQRIRNRSTAPHYRWGGDCDGWRLVEDDVVGIIEESVPPGRCETPHRHTKARQVFTILSGSAVMILDGERIELAPGDSMVVPAGALHQFRNDGAVAVRFLVISYPKSTWDRIDEIGPVTAPTSSTPERD